MAAPFFAADPGESTLGSSINGVIRLTSAAAKITGDSAKLEHPEIEANVGRHGVVLVKITPAD